MINTEGKDAVICHKEKNDIQKCVYLPFSQYSVRRDTFLALWSVKFLSCC